MRVLRAIGVSANGIVHLRSITVTGFRTDRDRPTKNTYVAPKWPLSQRATLV
jgi:hypothetical protein